MKKVILTFFCINFFAVNTIYSQLISRWNFTQNGAGVIPGIGPNGLNGMNATFLNLTPVNGFQGTPNGAMHFNGSSSQALVSNTLPGFPATFNNINNITMVALVRFSGFYAGACQANCIVSKGFPNMIPGNYQLHVDDNNFNGDCNSFNPNNERTAATFGTVQYNANWNTGGNFIQTGTWYLIAASYDGAFIRIYQYPMNPAVFNFNWASSLVPSVTIPATGGAMGTNTQSLSIGYHLNSNYRYWLNGDLDELLIYNNALSNTEMGTLYKWLWGKNGNFKNEDIDINNLGAINQSTETFTIEIYPNPATNKLNITLNSNSDELVTINIYDLFGRKYLSEKKPGNETIITLSSLNLKPGIYIIETKQGTQTKTKKLIIE